MIERELIGPYDISFDITNECNMRCLHCYNSSGENNVVSNEMNDIEVIKVVKEICKIKPMNICICGGEPLLRFDLLIKIVKLLRESDINVNTVSNGLLLTKDMIRELEEAGLNAIQISFDGIGQAYENLRGIKGSYEKLINALELLKDSKINKCISITPTKWNKNQLEDIAKICKKNNINKIRSQYLMPLGRGEKNFTNIVLSDSEYNIFIEELTQMNNKYLIDNLSFDWDDPSSLFSYAKDDDIYIPSMYIKANGNVLFSPYIPISFGNVRYTTLESIISNGFLTVYREDFLQEIFKKVKNTKDMSKISKILVKSFYDNDINIDEIRGENYGFK